MKIPIITDLLQRRGRRRLRRVMRGYRFLKVSNQLGRIAAVKEALTNTGLSQCDGLTSSLIFGAGSKDAELITRQYLLVRVCGLSFNKALLRALGKPGSDVVCPLPPEWRKVVEQHGFKVAKIRSALSWNCFVALFLAYGVVQIVKRFVCSVKEIGQPSRQTLGNYAYFNGLAPGNLPQPCKDGRSHDIVTWHQRWPGRVIGLDTLCHSVEGATPSAVDGIPAISVPSAIPPLTQIGSLVCFMVWGVASSSRAVIDFLRGRWWHALMLGEASSSATTRMHEPNSLARDYLFHVTSYIYRPLWTYEAKKQGSRVTFYFYAANVEGFKRTCGYPELTYGWQVMNWPHYLVWDSYQADFVRRAVGESANVSIVGPIWFHTSGEAVAGLPLSTVAVFDVQPMRASRYQILGADIEYYTPDTANQFLSDIYKVLSERGSTVALKRKREIGRLAHPKYRQLIRRFDRLSNFIAVDLDMSAFRLIEDCAAVISMPFTSTALIARELGKPSVFYDPTGQLQSDDRAAHGIPIVSGVEQLRAWFSIQVSSSNNFERKV